MTAVPTVTATGLRALSSDANKVQKVALALGLALAAAAILAPLIAPLEPNAQSLISRLRPPLGVAGVNAGHLLGTDELGRDLLTRCLYGLRLTLTLAVLGATLGLLIGGIVGVLAGVVGARTDAMITAAVDTQIAVPFTLVALFMLSVFGTPMTVMVSVPSMPRSGTSTAIMTATI